MLCVFTNQLVTEPNQILGMIKHNFSDRTKETVLLLYKSLVRPQLEYCHQIWSPHYYNQRRATKLVQDSENLQHDDRVQHLGSSHLESRRNRSNLIETFKTVNVHYNIKANLFFTFNDGGSRGHT